MTYTQINNIWINGDRVWMTDSIDMKAPKGLHINQKNQLTWKVALRLESTEENKTEKSYEKEQQEYEEKEMKLNNGSEQLKLKCYSDRLELFK